MIYNSTIHENTICHSYYSYSSSAYYYYYYYYYYYLLLTKGSVNLQHYVNKAAKQTDVLLVFYLAKVVRDYCHKSAHRPRYKQT